MNNCKTSFVILTVILGASLAQGQSFQNLDFELANPSEAPPYKSPDTVTAASAFPDWAVTFGSVQEQDVIYNSINGPAPEVALIGPGRQFGIVYYPIDGSYSAVLRGSSSGPVPSISQTGLIPSGTQSLLFKTLPSFGTLNVAVGTQSVQIFPVGSGPNYTLYAADISAWAGQTAQLTFSVPEGEWEIDDISFSPTAVPEPGIVTLSAMGGLLFGARKWFARI